MRAFTRSQENWAFVAVFSVFKMACFLHQRSRNMLKVHDGPTTFSDWWGTLINQMMQLLQFPGRLVDLLHQPNSTHLLSASCCLNHHTTPIMSTPLTCTHTVAVLVFVCHSLIPISLSNLSTHLSPVSILKNPSYPSMLEYPEYNMHCK